jgi:formyl-CoA transferase
VAQVLPDHGRDHPAVGKVRIVGSPVRLSKTPAKDPSPSPVHGQHTREVLRDLLGLTADEIARLEAAGVVSGPRRADGSKEADAAASAGR